MELAEYQNIFDTEKRHFFYRSLQELVEGLAEQVLGGHKRGQILDAGCGTGTLAKHLKGLGQVAAFDISDQALKFARKNGVAAKKGSLEKIPFSKNKFDLVTCIDVLISVKDDSKGLAELWRVTKPGGILILRVSAVPWLKLAHDRYVHSLRRYSRKELEQKLMAVGWRINRITGVHLLLLPLAIGEHFKEKWWPPRRDHSAIGRVSPLINWPLYQYLSWEGRLLRTGVNLPDGLGWLVIAQKPDDKPKQ